MGIPHKKALCDDGSAHYWQPALEVTKKRKRSVNELSVEALATESEVELRCMLVERVQKLFGNRRCSREQIAFASSFPARLGMLAFQHSKVMRRLVAKIYGCDKAEGREKFMAKFAEFEAKMQAVASWISCYTDHPFIHTPRRTIVSFSNSVTVHS